MTHSVVPVEGGLCPHCEQDILVYCAASEPWSDEHLICPFCDSTYNIRQEEHNEQFN